LNELLELPGATFHLLICGTEASRPRRSRRSVGPSGALLAVDLCARVCRSPGGVGSLVCI